LFWAVLAVALIAVVAAIYLVISQFVTKPIDDNPPPPKATSFASPAVLVATIKGGAEGTNIAPITRSGVGGTDANGYIIYSLPARSVLGKKFQTQPAEAVGEAYLGTSVVASNNYQKFVSFFNENHFKMTQSFDDSDGYISDSLNDYVPFPQYAVYESDDIVCSIAHVDASGTKLANHLSSIGCADKNSYKTTADAAVPFFNAYVKANAKAVPSDLVFGAPTEGVGTDGYKNAFLYQEDPRVATDEDARTFFKGYYYQPAGSSEWVYATSAIGTPDCDAFHTTDILKKAFNSVACSVIN
jgi:hypothetical protein